MDLAKYEVPVDRLRWRCDPAIFDFECTKDLAPLREFIGQDRAIRAIEFGLAMNHDGYNIYVAGLTGTGKTSIVRRYIEKLVEQRRAGDRDYKPQDWCYLYNFTEPDRPQVLALPRGKGRAFRERMVDLLKRLREELSKAFSSEEYQSHRKRIVEQNQSEQQKLFQEMEEDARRQGFMLQMTPMGPVAVPVSDGKPMSQEDYMALEEPVRKQLESRRADVINRLEVTFEKAREFQRELVERLQAGDGDVGDCLVANSCGTTRRPSSQRKIPRHSPEAARLLVQGPEPVRTAPGKPVCRQRSRPA